MTRQASRTLTLTNPPRAANRACGDEVAGGKLRGLIQTGATRSPGLPDVPTKNRDGGSAHIDDQYFSVRGRPCDPRPEVVVLSCPGVLAAIFSPR
jgi:hypothetical protein